MNRAIQRGKINFTHIIILQLLISVYSCSSVYQTQVFTNNIIPLAPNYELESNWAVLPWSYTKALQNLASQEQDTLRADVFYVYPTLFLDSKDTRWNIPVDDDAQNERVLKIAIQFQASAWATAGKLYVPYYRQAHIRAYSMREQGGEQAFAIAYIDIKAAFETYLNKYNKGRSIIIASHSQGTTHTKRLLKEFFDGKKLQKKLIAAYLPGMGINQEEFKNLKPMITPNGTGGFVSWNTFRKSTYPKKDKNWYKGKVTSNPISWDKATTTVHAQHKGFLYTNGKLYNKALKITIIDGLVWTSLPRFPLRLFALFKKNYHVGDIRENAELRVKEWHYEKTKRNKHNSLF